MILSVLILIEHSRPCINSREKAFSLSENAPKRKSRTTQFCPFAPAKQKVGDLIENDLVGKTETAYEKMQEYLQKQIDKATDRLDKKRSRLSDKLSRKMDRLDSKSKKKNRCQRSRGKRLRKVLSQASVVVTPREVHPHRLRDFLDSTFKA